MAQDNNIKELKTRIADLELEKTQLLKLVSHDVKSPFNKLFALSNLLQLVSENLNEEQLDYLIRMEWVVKEGLTVVRNLMDLRAIENKEFDFYVEELSIDAILNETIKNYSKQSDSKNLSFSLDINKVTTWSDKRAIDRIIDNIVSNAVKFTPKAGEIIISLKEINSKIELIVSSKSGPIMEEEVSNLFKRSSPLSTRPTHGESALGNGLFIAQSYANQLGGQVKFNQSDSVVEFLIGLPIKLGD